MGFTPVTPLTFPYSSLDWGFHYQLCWFSGLWTQTEIYLLILQLEARDILWSQLAFIICELIPIIIFCSSCCSWESWFIYYFINTVDDHLSPSQSVILIIYLFLGFFFVCSSSCLCRICILFVLSVLKQLDTTVLYPSLFRFAFTMSTERRIQAYEVNKIP